MYYTPGWGAVITAVSTLSGVALTQWNANRQSWRQHTEARRVEQRLAILDVLMAASRLEASLDGRLVFAIDQELNGTVIDDVDEHYMPIFVELGTRANELLHAVRKAELVITVPKIAGALDELNSHRLDLVRIITETEQAVRNREPDNKALAEATTTLATLYFELKSVTRNEFAR
jgi:uncharacterized protein (UPF0212 family)